MNLVTMRKHMTDNLARITKAPDRYALKAFGGTLTIEEFRNISMDTCPIVTLPNETFRMQTVGTKTVLQDLSTSQTQLTSGQKNEKMSAIRNASTHNDPLRLKRPKPLKRDQNNLEATLGIVRKRT
jgi:hypothetical protein